MASIVVVSQHPQPWNLQGFVSVDFLKMHSPFVIDIVVNLCHATHIEVVASVDNKAWLHLLCMRCHVLGNVLLRIVIFPERIVLWIAAMANCL